MINGSVAIRRFMQVLAISAFTMILLSACSSQDASTPADTGSKVAPSDDYTNATILAKCMTDKGWDVSAAADGFGGYAVDATYPSEQDNKYQSDMKSCVDDSFITPEIDESFAATSYDQATAKAQCLKDAGYDVPDIPSKQTYIADLVAGTLDFDPYSLVSPADLSTALSQCHE